MLPVSFPDVNKIYTKPEGWTDEQCSDLPVWQGHMQIDEKGNTAPTIISKWRLSKEDLEEINRTGEIFLSITSEVMIPASVFTENPFVHTNT